MSRPLIVVTESGLTTSASWWANCRVEGNNVVLSGSHEGGWPETNLIVAEHRSEAEARALFRKLNDRILLGAQWFDARDRAGLICREGKDAAGGRNR